MISRASDRACFHRTKCYQTPMPPWIEYFACAVCAISGVLAAEGKRMDLFGVLVLALVTAVGGGTIRDICLDTPVFWLRNPGTLLSV